MDIGIYIPQRVGISYSSLYHIDQSGTYGTLPSKIWHVKYTWINYFFIWTMSGGPWLQHVLFTKWNYKLHYLYDILDDFDHSGQIRLHHIYPSNGLSYTRLHQWISFTKWNCGKSIPESTSFFHNNNYNFDTLDYFLWSHCLSSSMSRSNQAIPTIEIDVQGHNCYNVTTNCKSINGNNTSSHVGWFISGHADYVLWNFRHNY